nr:hypothetical protein [Microbacterium hydrocarbonoxydans]
MSTSDRHEQGPLTRKQLREIRLTGSTPVISPEEAAAAASATPSAPPAAPGPQAPEPQATEPQATEPQAVEPSDVAPVSAEVDGGAPSTRLTRRQVRELERSRSGTDAHGTDDANGDEALSEDAGTDGEAAEAQSSDEPDSEPAQPEPSAPVADSDDLDDDADSQIVVATPVSASSGADRSADVSVVPEAELVDDAEAAAPETDAPESADATADDESTDDERPTVNSTFGQAVLSDEAEPAKPFTPSFDELLTVGDSTGSQHRGGNTLIFNPAPGDGSLSGPVASTGEILVTGSYELPRGLGSQGHAHGTTDGKDVDAVLIDGELPPASSPTPIAASAAVSTIKPAGEVIRPPAPEKGNKLMLILAIVAGGLALALGVALIVAFTTNVF